MPSPCQRTLIVGWDGVCWPLLDRLMARGLLPALQRLVREGARGDLLSVVPTATPAAWSSLVTGTNPGKHGIIYFRGREPGTYRQRLLHAGHRSGAPVWDVLGARGWQTGAVNVPLTYPVTAVNGFLLSGMETPNSFAAFAYPPALRDALNAAIPGGYRIDVGFRNPKEDYLARVRDLVDRRRQALRYCLDRFTPDFLMAVFVAPDRLNHIFWHCLDPQAANYDAAAAARYGPLLDAVWRDLDAALAELLERFRPARLALVSDHGAGEFRKGVRLNRWLRDAGYLVLRDGAGDRATLDDVDWPRTRAWSFSHAGEIFLNVRGREPQGCVAPGAAYDALCRELADGLQALRDDEDGLPLVDRAWRRDELYWGDRLDAAPDLLCVMRGGAYLARDGFEQGPQAFEYISGETCTGVHRAEGVLLLHGAGVRAGAALPPARLWDVVPTLLHAAGEPLTTAHDGRVLSEAFVPGALAWPPRRLPPPPAPAAAETAYDARQQAEIEERLRGLGYIE